MDIAPAPSWLAGAQAPVAGSPPASARPEPAPNAPPSVDPIPPLEDRPYKDPGPEPVRPKLLGPSQAENYWANVAGNPNVSDGMRAYARAHAGGARGLSQANPGRADQRLHQPASAMGNRHPREDEMGTRATDPHPQARRSIGSPCKRLSTRPASIPPKRPRLALISERQADLADKLFKADPVPEALDLANLQIIEARRKAKAPVEKDISGAIYRSQVDPVTGQQGAYSLAPGSPQPEPKALTQDQLRAAEFAIRTTPDLDRVEKELNNGKAMTYFKDGVLAAALPPGLSNKVVSDDYRRTQQALTNWGAAFMTHVSGAAYGNAEAERNLAAFIPRYGDTDQTCGEGATPTLGHQRRRPALRP